MTEDLRIRIGGLLSLAGATLAAWFFIIRPLQQAAAGVEQVKFHGKGAFVLIPLLVVWGAAFLIGGESARYRDTSVHPPKPTALGWILMLLSLVAAGLCFWWVQASFAALGYDFF
jgi:hypothetical protein